MRDHRTGVCYRARVGPNGIYIKIHIIINEMLLFSRNSGVMTVPIGCSGQVKANLFPLAPGRSATGSERVEYEYHTMKPL